MVVRVKPRIPKTHREFAEAYITMPSNGPRGGERFNADWQPVIRLLWEELDKEHWKELAATAPVQASKSFGALVVPTLRDVVELGYSPIVGVPEADMFADKWDKDFKPVFDSSPDLKWLTPSMGSGAKGGRVKDRVTLSNNVDIKVMSRGGQATNKAGYTSPRLRITEAAGFSQASKSETDNEADAYRQLVGRLGAFKLTDRRRFVAIEGTGTIEEDLPWRLRGADDDDVVISTRSRLVSPCPHCEAWISPEREHLVGWQQAESMLQALESARFVCPCCGKEIDDEQRRKSMQDVRVVHYGQSIRADGVVEGPLPPTLRLWFRWSSWHNLLLDAGDTAVKEWEAAQIPEGTEDRENAERDLCQKSWAIPYKPTQVEAEPLKPKVLARRRSSWEKNILPPDTTHFTIGVDLGKWQSWWFAIAARESGEVVVPAYEKFSVCTSREDEVDSHLKAALFELFDRFLQGFHQADHIERMLPESVWIDRGWKKDVVCEVVNAHGGIRENMFRASKGFGQTKRRRDKESTVGTQYRSPEKRTKLQIFRGNRWHGDLDTVDRIIKFNFDADYYKLRVQEWLRTQSGNKGALTFFRSSDSGEHTQVTQHLAAEQLLEVPEPGKGLVKKWVKKGQNHYLDAAAEAVAALDYCGFKLSAIPDPEPEGSDFYSRMRSAAA